MTPDQFRRIEQLYVQALDLAPDQRKTFLTAACPNETERERVVAMLEAHARDSGFLNDPAILVAAKMAAEPAARDGERIGHYRIVRRLGKGGMGEVYLANDEKLDRQVALKFLSSGHSSEKDRMRFIREAKAAAAINHSNVVAIHEIEEERGVTFIVMEYVEGKTVADRLLDGNFGVSEILDVGIQVASALEAAHAKGILHRDIKPRNLIITGSGQLKVLDFGLAKFIRPELLPARHDPMQTTGTSPGELMGTLPYMSPEQLMGSKPDHRTDLFSLGVVLYQLATGRVPFHGMLLEPIDQTFDRPIDPMDLQPRLYEIVSRCVRKKPEHRYSSASDLLTDLKGLRDRVERGRIGGLKKEKVARSLPRRIRWTLVATVLLAGIAFAVMSLWTPDTEEPRRAGRVFARSTSEGGKSRRIALNHFAPYLATSQNGDRLFVSDGQRRELSIIRTSDYSVKTIALPRDGGALAVSPTGDLYIGSTVHGNLLVLDGDDETLREPIPVGAPVIDMAFNLEGDKLYLAQSRAGLKRLSVGSNDLKLITDRICPEGLESDAQGMRLYVAYQCSGPSGKEGHDVVEIYDLKTETLVDTVGGPTIPMVGQKPRISPDGRLVMLDGADACGAGYDHVGCNRVPSHIYHLLDATTRRIIRSPEYDGDESSGLTFLDNSRFLMSGNMLTVVDANTFQFAERLNIDQDGIRAVIVSRDRKRAFFGTSRERYVLVFELDDAQCSPNPEGLALLYPGDGTFTEVVGQWGTTQQGNVQFVPGRVGQAFFLDGASFMSTKWAGRYQLGAHDFSVTAYVKFARTEGETDLVNWTDENPFRGIRLLKSADGSFVVQSGPNAGSLKSTTLVKLGAWYHVAVTRMDREIALYVNGVMENSGPPPEGRYATLDRPLLFGGREGKPTFQGWLDEITFYNRSLTQQEVRDQYLLREQGPCRL